MTVCADIFTALGGDMSRHGVLTVAANEFRAISFKVSIFVAIMAFKPVVLCFKSGWDFVRGVFWECRGRGVSGRVSESGASYFVYYGDGGCTIVDETVVDAF